MIDGWGRQKGVLVLKSTDKLIQKFKRRERGFNENKSIKVVFAPL